jgi:hypothetical protein
MEKWWGAVDPHVPLPGKLADYAAVVQRYNRALVSVVTNNSSAVQPANTNRVAVAIGANFSLTAVAMQGLFEFINPAGVTIWSHTVAMHEGDGAGLTPSPFTYNPLFLSVLELGPIIQGRYQFVTVGPVNMFCVELLINPSLDGGVP